MERAHQDFRDAFATGRLSESRIARWLIHEEHWNVLPAYDLELATGKGPRLFTPEGELVVPDLLAIKLDENECLLAWFEAKHKTHFTWYRRTRSWQTGIDLRHYLDYLKVQEQTGREVYLCFFHEGFTPSASDRANGSPSACPTGLYRQALRVLKDLEDHRGEYQRDGRRYQMVYWNERDLVRVATVEQVKYRQA